ncbi:MAG: T9SS type A sorting domain-containing protein, partial [Proteobacteria bacterium]|nr:T9SS type A sorting domain-containing protein [Pseudomonadota bacterium]
DLTGHIDMFCKLLNDSLFIVGEYGWQDLCYPGDDVMLDELAADLSSLNNLDGRPFTVARMPMGPWDPDGPYCAINRTHTNSLILNDKVLVPVYGFASDAEALTIYETLMPGYEIIGIDSENIIPYAGAIHCVTNTIHAANPLIVLHQPLHILPAGTAPEVSFTINPRFENTEASVFYRLESEMDFTEAAATRSLGVWSVSLPAMAADFCYYIAGQAVSGTTTLPVWLPEQAPAAFFEVDVIDDVAVDEMIEPRMILTCYPNPFNPMTTIRYGIPEHSAVNLRIFNVSGQLVRTLLQDESHSDGIFAIPWDGRDSYGQQMPTGTYFCRLETDDLVTTQRMTLVR